MHQTVAILNLGKVEKCICVFEHIVFVYLYHKLKIAILILGKVEGKYLRCGQKNIAKLGFIFESAKSTRGDIVNFMPAFPR